MAVASLPVDEVVDGALLKRRLRRAESRQSTWALVLVAPLLLFVLLAFVAPIAYLLRNAVYDPDIAQNLPKTVAVLEQWDGKDVPGEDAFAALVADLPGHHGVEHCGSRRQAAQL